MLTRSAFARSLTGLSRRAVVKSSRGLTSPLPSSVSKPAINTFKRDYSSAFYRPPTRNSRPGPSNTTKKSPILIAVTIGGVTYYVYHLEVLPETGRRRFIDVSASTEQEMGLTAFKETLSEFGTRILPPNHPSTRYVTDVAKRLIKAAGAKAEGVEWEVFVVKDDAQRNAFVTPGGKIFVFTGLLPVAKNVDGLATILGHEISHQLLRHSAERMSGSKVLYFVGLGLEAFFGVDMGISRILLTFLMELPNSRTAEREADLIGLKIMSRACYNPQEAIGLWDRMAKMDAGQSIEFLSTHPGSEGRKEKIKEWMPQMLDIRNSAECHSFSEFKSVSFW